jgi:hypothetical protein
VALLQIAVTCLILAPRLAASVGSILTAIKTAALARMLH